MAEDWIDRILRPQLAKVTAAIDEAAPSGWDPDPLRRLIADITHQINAATAEGVLTEDQRIMAARLLGETLRAHPKVTTQQQTIHRSSQARTFPLDEPIPPELLGMAAGGIGAEQLRPLFGALTEQLERAVSEGQLSAEAAAQAIARLRESYGLPPEP